MLRTDPWRRPAASDKIKMSKSGRYTADISQPADDPASLFLFFMLTHCPYFSNKINSSLSAEPGGYPAEARGQKQRSGAKGGINQQIHTDGHGNTGPKPESKNKNGNTEGGFLTTKYTKELGRGARRFEPNRHAA